MIRALFWTSILVTLASPARWLTDHLAATTILLSLQDATYAPHPETGPSQHLFDVEGDLRLAIFLHAPGQVEWRLDMPPGPHRFLVEVALDPEVWDKSDGARFTVAVIEGGKRRELGETIVNPRGRVADRGWVPIVAEFTTTTDDTLITLANDVGPAGRGDFDWAYWAEPRVVTLATAPRLASILMGLVGVMSAVIAARRRDMTLAADSRGLAFAAYTIVVSLTLIELLLRLFPSWLPPAGLVRDVAGPEFAAWADSLVADPDLAYRYRPNLSLTLPRDFRRLATERVPSHIEPRIDWIRFETDKDGFRNVHSEDNPEMIVLGDSFVAGDLVDGADTLGIVLSREMGVAVRSLAVSGYGPQQYLAALRAYGNRPRLVVVVLFEGNDLDEAEDFVQWQQSHLSWLEYATKVLRMQRSSIITRPRMRWRSLAALSAIGAGLSERASSRAMVRRPDDPFNPVCRSNDDPLDCMSFNGIMIYRESIAPEEWEARQGLSLTLDAVREMKRFCDGTEARFLVVLGPTKESVYLPRMAADVEPGTLDRYLEVMTRDVAIPPGPPLSERFARNKGTVGRLLKDRLEREGIAVLDLRPDFEAAAEQGRNLFFRFDLHWNEAGHAEVARLIDNDIARRGWLLSQNLGEQ